ncbi:MAG TPA: polymorphic toxin type 6 domain-containing protein [Nostocaceae cyanobacterium]|nr:polymorphic toxin type 6 domain-containing protein [Nostocaceae cyanobacterium]
MSKATQIRVQTKTPQTPPKTPQTSRKPQKPKQKATDLRTKGVNATIVAAPNIRLVDNRTEGFMGFGNQNLKENAYLIAPRLSATLGQRVGQLENVNFDAGIQSANNGNTITTVVSMNPRKNPSTSEYAYDYHSYEIKYHVKNSDKWDLGNLKAKVDANNTKKFIDGIRGAGTAGAGTKLLYKGIPIEVGAKGTVGKAYEDTTKLASSFNYEKDFNPQGNSLYFDHQHTVRLTLSSTGMAWSKVITHQIGKPFKDVFVVTDYANDERFDPNTGAAITRKGEFTKEDAQLFR